MDRGVGDYVRMLSDCEMKRAIVILSMLVLCTGMTAQVPSSLECDFVQTIHTKMLKKDAVSYGSMSFHSPDSLRWEYTSPMKFALIMKGAKVSFVRDGRPVASDANQSRFFGEITKMMLGVFSVEDYDANGSFTTSVSEDGNVKTIKLVPQKKAMQQFMSEMTLHYDMASETMLMVKMLTKSGDSTVIEFKNVRKAL